VASNILAEANLALTKAQHKAKFIIQLSLLGLAAITTISAGIITHAKQVTQQLENQKKQAIIAQIEALNSTADSTTGLGSVNWSGDSKTVAGGSMDGNVRVWGADGTLVQTFKGHQADVWSLSFSPDRTTLASAGKDSSVRLWSLDAATVETGELDKLLAIGCDWLGDYLQNNPNVEKDRHLCEKTDN